VTTSYDEKSLKRENESASWAMKKILLRTKDPTFYKELNSEFFCAGGGVDPTESFSDTISDIVLLVDDS
jgi:hypothetical protein